MVRRSVLLIGLGLVLCACHVLADDGSDADGSITVPDSDGGSVTVTSDTTVGQEIAKSGYDALTGFCIFFLGFPALWFNERRKAVMQKVFGKAMEICVDGVKADDKKALEKNDSCLVCVQGTTKNDKPIELMGVKVTGCVALSKQVEMFQWIEDVQEKQTDTKSGGKETTKTYTYKEEWSLSTHDSSIFQNKGKGHENPKPPAGCEPTGIAPVKTYADVVTFGEFQLPQELKQKCFKDEPCKEAEVKSAKGPAIKDKKWDVDKEGYYTTVKGGKPAVGDVRIQFKKVPCGPATVMAIQVTDSVKKVPSFVAYKNNYHTPGENVPGAKIALPSDVERPLLAGGQENKQDAKSIKKVIDASDEGCCNICRKCDAMIEAHEEIFHIEQKHISGAQMMKAIMSQQNLIHKLITIVGYCMIVGGLYMMLQFIPALFRIIPFVGSWVEYFGDLFMKVVAFVLGTFLALVTIALAWLRYHPKFGLMVLALALVVLFGPTVYGHVMVGQ